MLRWLLTALSLVALAIPMGGSVHADSNADIVVVPSANGAREVGWSDTPAYGELNGGHLPGKLFANGIDRDLDAVRGYTDNGELMLRYVGGVDELAARRR